MQSSADCLETVPDATGRLGIPNLRITLACALSLQLCATTGLQVHNCCFPKSRQLHLLITTTQGVVHASQGTQEAELLTCCLAVSARY